MELTENAIRVLIGLVTTLIVTPLGVLVGHRLSLGRDKRLEFNSAIKPIRNALLKDIIISEEMMISFEAATGLASNHILNTYRDIYKPAMSLETSTAYLDPFGQLRPKPISQEQVKLNKSKQDEAKRKMLLVCELK